MMRAFLRLLLTFCCVLQIAVAQPLPDRAPLSGFAFDSGGKPLPNAIISLRRQESSGPYTFWGATTASDARGAWRFPQAEAGRYYISAEAPGFAPVPNQSLNWKIGDVPLKLRFERLLNLQLKLLGAGGAPLAGTPLWIRLRGSGEAGQTTRRTVTDSDGQASLDGLLPATYALYLAAPGGFAIQNGLALRENRTLELALQRGGTLQASATQAGVTQVGGSNGVSPRGVGGAILSITPENQAEATRALGNSADLNENVALLAAGGDTLALLSRDGDGGFEIPNLPPGRYLARLLSSQFAPLEPRAFSIAAGQTTSLQFEMTPLAASSATPLASLALRLQNRDASGAESAPRIGEWSLRILPIDASGALAPDTSPDTLFLPGGNAARRALSDASGQIRLFPLRVGRYRVFVAPRTPAFEGEEPAAASIDVTVPAAGASATLFLPAAERPAVGQAVPAVVTP